MEGPLQNLPNTWCIFLENDKENFSKLEFSQAFNLELKISFCFKGDDFDSDSIEFLFSVLSKMVTTLVKNYKPGMQSQAVDDYSDIQFLCNLQDQKERLGSEHCYRRQTISKRAAN